VKKRRKKEKNTFRALFQAKSSLSELLVNKNILSNLFPPLFQPREYFTLEGITLSENSLF